MRGQRRIAWGELALVTALAAFAAVYLLDARRVSLSVKNLLLVQPTALLVLGLWGAIALSCLRRGVENQTPADWRGQARVLALVAAFGLFILGLDRVGYDIAMVLFVAVALRIGGERSPIALLVFPPAFTALVVLGFRALVPYPFPTTIL